MLTMEEEAIEHDEQQPPAPGWGVAGLSAEAPPYGRPAALLWQLAIHAPAEALQAINLRGREDRERLHQRLTAARKGCEALAVYRRAQENRQVAEAALAAAQLRERQAARAIEQGIRAISASVN